MSSNKKSSPKKSSSISASHPRDATTRGSKDPAYDYNLHEKGATRAKGYIEQRKKDAFHDNYASRWGTDRESSSTCDPDPIPEEEEGGNEDARGTR